jgi:S-adenosylmethionine decarboxylase
MTQAPPCLHPNPGWTGAPSPFKAATLQSGTVGESNPVSESFPVSDNFPASDNFSVSDTVGKHCILELYNCDPAKLDDEAFLRTAITSAAKKAGATLLNLITHRFEPQGVTGLALLAESHISIHTWPESGYAAVDVFTCGDHTMPERACQVLAGELSAGNHKLTSFRRETPSAIADVQRDPSL